MIGLTKMQIRKYEEELKALNQLVDKVKRNVEKYGGRCFNLVKWSEVPEEEKGYFLKELGLNEEDGVNDVLWIGKEETTFTSFKEFKEVNIAYFSSLGYELEGIPVVVIKEGDKLWLPEICIEEELAS